MSGYIKHLTCSRCLRTFPRPADLRANELDIMWSCHGCRRHDR